MTVRSRTEVEALLAHAEAAYSDYIALAERAVASGSPWSKRRAAVAAVKAMDVLAQVTAELAHKTCEADTAHEHFVAAARGESKHIGAEMRLCREVIRLQAENDQLRAAVRDCPHAGGAA